MIRNRIRIRHCSLAPPSATAPAMTSVRLRASECASDDVKTQHKPVLTYYSRFSTSTLSFVWATVATISQSFLRLSQLLTPALCPVSRSDSISASICFEVQINILYLYVSVSDVATKNKINKEIKPEP